MSSVSYVIVFSGEIVDGFQLISVKAHLAKLLKADVDKMAVLFSGKTVVIKRTTDKQEALKYGTALKKVGADVKVKAIKSEQAPAPKTPREKAPTPKTPATEAGPFSVAPLQGNLVEPAPAPPPLQIDLSGLQLAENDGSNLMPPRPTPVLELDLSEYSLGDLDGTPLVEPKLPPPKVDAPDFTLDEPGAVLETLEVEKPPSNPDISDLSLAEPGADLLGPADKAQAPPPKVPDISNIRLAPNN